MLPAHSLSDNALDEDGRKVAPVFGAAAPVGGGHTTGGCQLCRLPAGFGGWYALGEKLFRDANADRHRSDAPDGDSEGPLGIGRVTGTRGAHDGAFESLPDRETRIRAPRRTQREHNADKNLARLRLRRLARKVVLKRHNDSTRRRQKFKASIAG